jgi:hypothetical protein
MLTDSRSFFVIWDTYWDFINTISGALLFMTRITMAKRKEHTRGTAKTEETFMCSNFSCGLVFSKPIKVKNLCEDSGIYDACPRCFTAVTEPGNIPVIQAKPSSGADTDQSEAIGGVEGKKLEPVATKHCPHKFGYLSERPKNVKIPDDCMVCENIVKCMTKGITG